MGIEIIMFNVATFLLEFSLIMLIVITWEIASPFGWFDFIMLFLIILLININIFPSSLLLLVFYITTKRALEK